MSAYISPTGIYQMVALVWTKIDKGKKGRSNGRPFKIIKRASLMTTGFIQIENVSHTYKTQTGPLPVLDNLSVNVRQNGFTSVVGPSGCGKSTLTRLIAGLLKPDSGVVRLAGEKVSEPRATVGMAFQNPVLLEWRTIVQNVILPLEIVGSVSKFAKRKDRALELLALVGLSGFENKRPSELSGGMRQRASLCRALVHKPEVLILDEPFAALDAFTREDLWQVMHKLKEKEPFTGVLITHDLRESIFLSDQVVVLSGRPATSQYVLDIPQKAPRALDDLYTAESIEMLNDLRHQIKIAQGRGNEKI